MNPNLVDMKEMKNRMIQQFVSQSNHLVSSTTIPSTITNPTDSTSSLTQVNYSSYPTPAALMAAITAAALNASNNIPINNTYSLLNKVSNKTQDNDQNSRNPDTDNFEEDDENHLIKKTDHEYTHDTPPRSSSQSSLINSSPSSVSKKKGLSDIINKLNKQSKDSSPSDQNFDTNENLNKDTDTNDNASLFKSRSCTSNSLTSNYNTNSIGCSDTVSNASSSSISGGASNSNCIGSNDYAMSAAEKISHLINVVATQNLSPPLSNVSNLDSNSSLTMNKNNDVKTNKSQMGLFNLLERANLVQYMNSFIEQGGDDLNQLLEADEEEFKEICDLVGMSSKPLHVKRLRKAIDELKSQKNTQLYNLTTSKSSSSSSSSTSSTTSFSISNLCSSSRNDSTSQQLPKINNQSIYPFYQYLPNNTDKNESTYGSGFVNNSMTAAATAFNHLNMFQKFNNSSSSLLATNPSLSILNNKLMNSKHIQDENENSNDKSENRVEDQDEEGEAEKYDYEDEDDNEDQDHEYDDTYDGEETDDIDVGKNSSDQNMSRQASIKMEQNEKMIKKNKVIELYTKGERCVRKLSQLTGVPLTTVYRVIGKLKGINYNIPRGNGAGRKTILDGQDREILVEILNAQPRISRKALGKELEKRTGKSIHNSTLNRELCRLRHHGHNFAATLAAANSATANNLNENDSNDDTTNANIKQESSTHNTANSQQNNTNYLKHFNNRKSQSSLSLNNENNQIKSDQVWFWVLTFRNLISILLTFFLFRFYSITNISN
jgi:transposase